MKKSPKRTSKKFITIAVSVYAAFLMIFVGSLMMTSQEKVGNQTKLNKNVESKVQQEKKIICDGINITKNCKYDNIQYETYKYYPAVAEKSHTERKTTYQKKVTGYCTLCNDGTYSPSCATGRGACSHHGGVAEWNAPVYSTVAIYEDIKIVDSPAIAEKYEKIAKNVE